MHAVAAFFVSIITFVSSFFAPTIASNTPVDIRTTQPAAAATAQTEVAADPFNDPAATSAVAATILAAPTPSVLPAPSQTVINQPVIERIIERIVPQGAATVSTQTLAAILSDFEQSISSRIVALNPPKAAIPEQVAAAGNTTGTFYPASQRIDQLTNTAINTPSITGGSISGANVAGYLPLSGGTLTGTLSGTDLNLSGALTAGTLNIGGLSSSGALFAPYFSATSTTATSSFAGGLTAANGSFSILQNGNVGIGTAAPSIAGVNSNSRVLSIVGDGTLVNARGVLELANPRASGSLAANDTAGSAFFIMSNNSGNPYIAGILGSLSGSGGANGFGGKLQFQTKADNVASSATTKMVLDQNGNIGIGTTTPNAQLAINTGVTEAMRLSGLTAGRGIFADNGASSGIFSLTRQDTVATGDLSIAAFGGIGFKGGSTAYNNAVSSGYAMYLNSSGNVGIGTTTPSVPFHVVSTLIPQARIAYDSSNYTDVRYDGFNTVGGAQTFLNAGSEKMRISSAGNVGIGTTTPGSILHLESSLPILSLNTNTSGNSARINFRSNNALTSVISADFTDNSLQFFNNGATRLYIGNTGNIGIGTTTPQQKLAVSSSGDTRLVIDSSGSGSQSILSFQNQGAAKFEIRNQPSGGSQFLSIGRYGGNDLNVDNNGNVGIGTTTPWGKLSITGSGTGTGLAFAVADSANTPRFSVLDNGKVGIGTTTPQANLHIVQGGVTDAILSIEQNVSGTNDPLLRFIILATANTWVMGTDNSDSDKFKIARNTIFDGTREYWTLDTAGNVGIGTTTPTARMTISTSNSEVAAFNSDNVNGGYIDWNNGGSTIGLAGAALPLAEAGFSASDFSIRARNNLLFISNGGISNRYMMWTNAGNLGIGTTSPTAQLSTTGTVRFSNFGAGTLTTDASGNLSVSSDERLKNIDGAFSRGLADIVKLTPISYHWNDISGLDKSTQYAGFSAQNVQTAIPEAVGSSTNGYLTLQDRPLIATVVNAIKELAQQFSNLAERVVTKELVAVNGSFRNIRAEELCFGDSPTDESPVCLTKSQVAAVLAAASQSAISPSPASVGAPQAPVIELNGNATSTIEVGDTYNDLGARIIAPESDLNLGIVIVLDGATTTAISIDTSVPGEHTILYTVTSPTSGLTGSAMRAVIVSPATQSSEPPANDNPFNAPPANDNVSTSTLLNTEPAAVNL